jgi:hypothetical protein
MVKTQKFDNLKVCLQKFLKKSPDLDFEMRDQINAPRQWAINQKQQNFSQFSKQSLELLNRKKWQPYCVEIYCNQSSICWDLSFGNNKLPEIYPLALWVLIGENRPKSTKSAQNQHDDYISLFFLVFIPDILDIIDIW